MFVEQTLSNLEQPSKSRISEKWEDQFDTGEVSFLYLLLRIPKQVKSQINWFFWFERWLRNTILTAGRINKKLIIHSSSNNNNIIIRILIITNNNNGNAIQNELNVKFYRLKVFIILLPYSIDWWQHPSARIHGRLLRNAVIRYVQLQQRQ